MSTVKSKLNRELHIICRNRSLNLSRYIMILLLLITAYSFGLVSFYLIGAFCIIPLIIKNSFSDPAAEQRVKNALLSETMKQFRFTSRSYRSESMSSIILILILTFWHVFVIRNSYYTAPLCFVPAILLILYMLCRVFIYLFYRFWIHYNFIHLNI